MTTKKTEQQIQYIKMDISRWENQLFNHQKYIDYHIKKENELIKKILIAKKEVDKNDKNIKRFNKVLPIKPKICNN